MLIESFFFREPSATRLCSGSSNQGPCELGSGSANQGISTSKRQNRVADAVMQMPEVQRQPDEEKKREEEFIQTKPLSDQITPLVQR